MTTEQKLDRLIQLIEGSGESAPGIVSRVSEVEKAMFGHGKDLGVKTKVTIMWRIHIWLLCTASGLAGYALKTIIGHM